MVPTTPLEKALTAQLAHTLMELRLLQAQLIRDSKGTLTTRYYQFFSKELDFLLTKLIRVDFPRIEKMVNKNNSLK